MSKILKSNNTSKLNNKSNNNIKNDDNFELLNDSSFINSKGEMNLKLETNSKEKETNFRNFTQSDKLNFIKNCINKAENRYMDEMTKMNDMKSLEEQYISSIDLLKKDIDQVTQQIDVVILKREEAERKLKNKKVFLEVNMGKEIEENEEKKTAHEVQEINKVLQGDIKDIENEMEMVKKEIEVMSHYSLELNDSIENLKKKREDLLKNNTTLQKRIDTKLKELKKIKLDIKKIENRTEYQDLNNEIFLRNIEKWANKKSIMNNEDDEGEEQDLKEE